MWACAVSNAVTMPTKQQDSKALVTCCFVSLRCAESTDSKLVHAYIQGHCTPCLILFSFINRFLNVFHSVRPWRPFRTPATLNPSIYHHVFRSSLSKSIVSFRQNLLPFPASIDCIAL